MPKAKEGKPSNHVLRLGARSYAGHTGSIWDEPAKALKAGSHGVPGGENMVMNRRGGVRYFTVREMARLHGMPDFSIDCTTWKRPVLQLGNGIPVQVGKAFGFAMKKSLEPIPITPPAGAEVACFHGQALGLAGAGGLLPAWRRHISAITAGFSRQGSSATPPPSTGGSGSKSDAASLEEVIGIGS